VDVNVLLEAMARHGTAVSRQELDEVVATSDKKRFAFSDDSLRIRASQGHSVQIDLGLQPTIPPEFLYHGTADRFLPSIRQAGLEKRQRQHVHLSATPQTATQVGQRHGRPVILQIRAGDMHRAGLLFYLSANGVWLTDSVPVAYIIYPV
jgi:putative RNA 2'-phosphotransferase